MSFFVYRSLTPNEKRIRLINLLPRSARAPLTKSQSESLTDAGVAEAELRVKCTISHVSLGRTLPYLALSYTWGDASKTGIILVGDALLKVGKNLEVALAHLTKDDEPLTLWIDALCIDQNDNVEKSEQVQQMHQIYSRAAAVITWLGPAADNSDVVMDWIQQYGSLAHKFGIGNKPELRLRRLLQKLEADPVSLEQEGLRKFLEEISAQLSHSSHDHDSVSWALSKFFKRSYWRRIWVVQELVHAKSVQFLCGDKVVLEEPLHHALRLVRNFGQHWHFQHPQAVDLEVESNAIDTRSPINMLKFRRADGFFPLIYLMRTLRYFNATDPRDRIFALLSFAADTAGLGLRPNYEISHQQVYLEATISLLKDGYFDILSLCGAHAAPSELPSWVPDFAKMSYRAPLQQRAMKRGAASITTVLQPEYRASENAQHKHSFLAFNRAPPVSVSLYAKFMGQVVNVGTVWQPQGFQKWLQELTEFSHADGLSRDDDHMKAILRTAVADQEIRQATQKPRMSERVLKNVHSLLQSLDLSTADAQSFLSLGIKDYLYQLQDVAYERRPFSMSTGHIGIGPSQMMTGDSLYVLSGADVPFILRSSADGRLELIGEAYVHGIMDGEALKEGSSADLISLH
ncbi:heterokaryon incompatibility protein-domain-containing protein [Paraphoma chrysanthemicola]|uniref:Heterokaryon incompatibility protein-domain-containing protein n=1 Tax=Paraphoma chrysanthemicola TaxID=798071 RepID=A0A8K0QYJ9_9PLEO|nr:heterokaryon incompatibility protein-domain-containing protein [Paraphoma chrysanthemicola]